MPLRASLAEDVKMEYYPSEEPALKACLVWRRLVPPVAQGDCVGEIRVLADGDQIAAIGQLFAENCVDMTLLYRSKLVLGRVGALFIQYWWIFLVLNAFFVALLYYKRRSRKSA